jgi:hypothetical protein
MLAADGVANRSDQRMKSNERSAFERKREVVEILSGALIAMLLEQQAATATGSDTRPKRESSDLLSAAATHAAESAKSKPAERSAAPDVIALLARMSLDELTAKFREVFHKPTHSKNETYLRKRLALRLAELGHTEHHEPPVERPKPNGRVFIPFSKHRAPKPIRKRDSKRDVRLPPFGAVLTREYQGERHEVRVLRRGFEYRGVRYRSLSKVATAITGTIWNGFVFFGLAARRAGKAKAK